MGFRLPGQAARGGVRASWTKQDSQ